MWMWKAFLKKKKKKSVYRAMELGKHGPSKMPRGRGVITGSEKQVWQMDWVTVL